MKSEKKERNLQLMLPRNGNAIIADGYRLYTSFFKTLFLSTWVVAVVYAIAMSIVGTLYMNALSKLAIIQQTGLSSLAAIYSDKTIAVLLIVGPVLLFASTALLISQGYAALSTHQHTGSMKRTSKKWYGGMNKKMLTVTLIAVGWSVLLGILVCSIHSVIAWLSAQYLGHWSGIALTLLSSCLWTALLMPLTYTITFYVMEEPRRSFLATFTKTYTTGLRHWGRIFIVLLTTLILASLLVLVTELPACILFLANIQSQLGLLQGDEAGMPNYLLWLNLSVFAIAGFIQAYIHLFMLFPQYYLYGSIVTEEEELHNTSNIS